MKAKRRIVRAEPTVSARPEPSRRTQGDRLPQDFLLEIGCEEIPADYMPSVLDWNWPSDRGFAAAAESVFHKSGIVWKQLQSFGTPRRLVLLVEEVQPFVQEEIEGPPVSIAFDAQGQPTEAAKGFARKQGILVSSLTRKETPKGPRLLLQRKVPVTDLLAGLIPTIIQLIAFPKTMRWDSSGVRFARPVRWLLALYGTTPVKTKFGLIQSGKATYPAAYLRAKPVLVPSASAYFSILKKMKVELEEGTGLERGEDGQVHPLPLKTPKRDRLLASLRRAAQGVGGRVADETTEEFQWLLNTVTFLAEAPAVQSGFFRMEYLDLPAEVLATSMAKHLKLFSVYSKDGKQLLPKFLAVLEGAPSKPKQVMANYERILEARFSDARFFHEEDIKTSLEAKVPKLEKIIFHEKLGTVAERIPRMQQLMKRIVEQIPPLDGLMELKRAALLSKADLVTQMVREFPSLQGIMGGYYAGGYHRSEELKEDQQAIAEHYRPRAMKDPVPSTALGAVLSLADRLDTLIGYFGVGLKPTGSADPYALRRQALGFVRILIEPPKGVSFVGLSIDRLCDQGIQSWGPRLTADPKILKREIKSFLKERFEWLSFVIHQIDREQIAAVLSGGLDDDLGSAWQRLQVLRRMWDSKDGMRRFLEQAAKVAERTGRIVKSVRGLELPEKVDADRLQEQLEKELWNTWTGLEPKLREQLSRHQYEEAVRTYSRLYPEISAFFEKVFVMDENMDVRRNRLALMKEIHRPMSEHFADLSLLPLPAEVS